MSSIWNHLEASTAWAQRHEDEKAKLRERIQALEQEVQRLREGTGWVPVKSGDVWIDGLVHLEMEEDHFAAYVENDGAFIFYLTPNKRLCRRIAPAQQEGQDER